MKLSELSTEALARTLSKLAPPLCRVAKDPRVNEALQEIRGDDPLLMTFGRMGEILLPALTDEHWTDVVKVVSILTETPASVIRLQNGRDTMRQFLQCVDEVLVDFFSSADGSMKGTFFGESSAQRG